MLDRRTLIKGAAASAIADRFSFAMRRGPAIIMRNPEIGKLGLGAAAVADYFRRIEWAQAQSAVGESYDYPFRKATDQPYNMLSPWNTPLGTGAVLSTSADNDHNMLQGWSSVATCQSGNNFVQEWVTSTASDPLMTTSDGNGAPDGAGSNIPIHIPAGIFPWGQGWNYSTNKAYPGVYSWGIKDTAQGVVCHMYSVNINSSASPTVYQTDNTTFSGGKIKYFLGRFDDLYGDGISPCSAPGMPSTRSNRYGWANGLISVEDILNFYASGSRVDAIKHMIRFDMSFDMMNGYADTADNSTGWPFPNFAVDYCYNRSSDNSPYPTHPNDTSNCQAFSFPVTPPAGSNAYAAGAHQSHTTGGVNPCQTMCLPPDLDIYSLRNTDGTPFTPEQLSFAWTWQNFGGTWRDTTGGHQVACKFSASVGGSSTSGHSYYNANTLNYFKQATKAWPIIVANLCIIRNYATSLTDKYPYGGGGQFLCAPPPRLTSRG